MYFLVKMGIFQPAMLVYQSVANQNNYESPEKQTQETNMTMEKEAT